VQQLQQKIQSTSLKNISIELLPSKSIPDNEINSEFSNHIKNILNNITTKPAIEMTPEELQVLSLFISYKRILPEVKIASEIVIQQIEQLEQTEKVITEDASSEENIQMVSTLISKVSGPEDLTNKQVQIIQTITNNTIKDITNLSQLYESDAPPQEISSASTSAFLNLFGYLSFLLSMIACYKNRNSDFAINLKQKNPIIHFIMSTIFACIDLVLFAISKVFLFLINTRVGRIYLTFVFLKLYKENNAIAVFIANIIVKIAGLIDKQAGISSCVKSCIETIKQSVIAMIPDLLNNSSITALLTTAIGAALSSPAVLANFINSLSPELSSQIIQQSMPVMSQALTTAMSQASPQFLQLLTEGVTQGVTQGIAPQIVGAISEGTLTVVAELAPALIEGITTSVSANIGTMITDVAVSSVAQASAQVAQQQITTTVLNSFTKTAIGYGIQYATYYLTGDASTGETVSNLLTSSGGKKSKKIHKNKNNKNNNKKTIKGTKSKKQKKRNAHSKTHKNH
jgi:uncharacterized Tic20 family protein